MNKSEGLGRLTTQYTLEGDERILGILEGMFGRDAISVNPKILALQWDILEKLYLPQCSTQGDPEAEVEHTEFENCLHFEVLT